MKQEEMSLEAARNRTVVKANELIQKSRFTLTLQQQKVVLYLISQITPYDDDFKLYEFSINEFCKVCGIDETNGKNYLDLKQAVKDIADNLIDFINRKIFIYRFIFFFIIITFIINFFHKFFS